MYSLQSKVLPGTLTQEQCGPLALEHLSTTRAAIRVLSMVGAGALPVDVDSVFSNLCPVWFCFGFWAGGVGEGLDGQSQCTLGITFLGFPSSYK